MRKTIVAASLASALALPGLAFAQAAAPAAAPAPAPSDHTFTGNAGLFSSYRFRGIDQTFGKPAIQGVGIEWSHCVFVQTLGQSRGKGAIEFSFSEKRLNGGSGGHTHLYFAKLSLL